VPLNFVPRDLHTRADRATTTATGRLVVDKRRRDAAPIKEIITLVLTVFKTAYFRTMLIIARFIVMPVASIDSP
jgi:hypothetical protein